jgi:aspartyl-tRNA(Asn)/glutamyl-tRNA(Gln) amidotransferase subunit B
VNWVTAERSQLALLSVGTVSSTGAKAALAHMASHGTDAAAAVAATGAAQVSDEGALGEAVDQAIAAHPAEAERFRGGETKLLQFFVGQVMRATRGTANPQLVTKLVAERMNGHQTG